jgi:ssDNA-binding Zn-finger/Zn-ribbon topoisomerase 1
MSDEKPPVLLLSFEKEYQLGGLPTVHISKDGKVTPFPELSDQHLYLAWRWFFENSYSSATYMALQREKERRRHKLPLPEEAPAPLAVACSCGAPMALRKGTYGRFWGCTKFPECKTTLKADDEGKPVGAPVSQEVRAARIRAHAAFDQLWQKNAFSKRVPMKRTRAYAWLREVMGLTEEQGHIKQFDQAQCEKLIALVNEYLRDEGIRGKEPEDRL